MRLVECGDIVVICRRGTQTRVRGGHHTRSMVPRTLYGPTDDGHAGFIDLGEGVVAQVS
jgi:hypothetical protein